MIVDDNSIFCDSLAVLFEAEGWEYIIYKNGEEVLGKLSGIKADVAVLDVKMPGKVDGLEVCKAIKGDKKLKNTYVIILSGMDSPEDIMKAKKAGADEYMVKPYSPDVIKGKIKQLNR